MDYNYYMNALKVIAVAESFGYLNPPGRDRVNFYADNTHSTFLSTIECR